MPKTRIVGVVPARSGSKGIPGKNIKLFLGKPLLSWAIECGLKSGVLDKVILLTDSLEYAEIGRVYGAEAPWLEPADLSSDKSHVFDGLKWLMLKLKEIGELPDYVVLLEPTAPGRQPGHIRDLVKLVMLNQSDSGFTVVEIPSGHNANWQFSINEFNVPTLVTGQPVKEMIRRRQLLPPLYVRGGSTYIAHSSLLIQEKPDMYGEKINVLQIDAKYGVDVDSDADWQEAESIVSKFVNE